MPSLRRVLLVAGLAVAAVTATVSATAHHSSGQAGSVWMAATHHPSR